jgi:hypothetical protein
VLGVTDGLRLAAVFERAGVDLGPVGQCVQEMSTERVTSVVGGHLDSQRVHLGEPTLHFHIWDALVATCLDRIRARK